MNGFKYYNMTVMAGALMMVLYGTATAQEPVVENDAGLGARSMGMGSAQIGAVDDVSAVQFNPAALARIEETKVQFGLTSLNRTIDTTMKGSRGESEASASSSFFGLGTLGIAYPVPTERGSLVFAVAVNRMKDFHSQLEIDGYNDFLRGFQTGESIEEGGLHAISLAGAVDVSPTVSVGASFDIWYGTYERSNRTLLNDYDDPYSQLDIWGAEDNISAWSFKPSILYHNDKVRFGAYARLPMTFHIDEDNYSEGYSRADGEYFGLYQIIDPSSPYNDADYTYTDALSYTVSAPMQMGLGLSLGTPGTQCIAVDMVYENWEQAELDYPSDYYEDPNYFRNRYSSSISWRVGLEQSLNVLGLVGRLGYIHQPLVFEGPRGYEEDAPRINVTDDRNYLTFGLGKRFDRSFSFDAAYTYGYWSQKESPRTDDETSHRLYFTVTYHMPASIGQ